MVRNCMIRLMLKRSAAVRKTIQNGGPFGSFPAWGDYSYTSLDPDGLTIWTIQEYAETRYDPQLYNAFGTRIAAITPF